MPQPASKRFFVSVFYLIPRGVAHQNRHISAVGRMLPMNENKSPISVEVVGQIAQTYFGHCPYEADSAHDHVSCPLRLYSENMFNPGADLRSCPVSLQFPFRELVISTAFALQMLTISIFMQLADAVLRPVGRISPHITAGIARIQQLVKHIAVVHFGTGYMKTSDQFMLCIHRYVVFIAERTLTILLGPASVRVFLALLILAPALICVFSSRLLRCIGTRTMLASMICPF